MFGKYFTLDIYFTFMGVSSFNILILTLETTVTRDLNDGESISSESGSGSLGLKITIRVYRTYP